ncbi:hypothetical protein ACFOWC_17455 [Pedobacter mendelii]
MSKILSRKTNYKGLKSQFEKVVFIILISAIIFVLNFFSVIFSYTHYWDKMVQTLTGDVYSATVIGYKQEIIRSKSFASSNTYSDKIIFFPKVEYLTLEGIKLIKTVNATSNHPPKIGQKVKITHRKDSLNANAIELDWIVLLGGTLFSGVAMFFLYLLSSYIGNFAFRKRIRNALYLGAILAAINLCCIIIIFLRQ